MSEDVTFDRDELGPLRQWFDALQDVNPECLEDADRQLAKKIVSILNRLPPPSA